MTRLLLDENMPRSAAARLTEAGHDVLCVHDVAPGADDLEVLSIARAEARCLLTFDADFGTLVFRHGALPPPAIVYLRMHPIAPDLAVALALRALTDPVEGHLVVIGLEDLRKRRFPGPAAGGSR